jgi:hypothetical protein
MLWLDLDGTLADFREGVWQLFPHLRGTDPDSIMQHMGKGKFWEAANNAAFFTSLPPFDYTAGMVRQLQGLCNTYGYTLGVLTAVPGGNVACAAADQKLNWCRMHVGANVKFVACLASEKPQHCKPGDILVDDRVDYRHSWITAGGAYVEHRSDQWRASVLAVKEHMRQDLAKRTTTKAQVAVKPVTANPFARYMGNHPLPQLTRHKASVVGSPYANILHPNFELYDPDTWGSRWVRGTGFTGPIWTYTYADKTTIQLHRNEKRWVWTVMTPRGHTASTWAPTAKAAHDDAQWWVEHGGAWIAMPDSPFALLGHGTAATMLPMEANGVWLWIANSTMTGDAVPVALGMAATMAEAATEAAAALKEWEGKPAPHVGDLVGQALWLQQATILAKVKLKFPGAKATQVGPDCCVVVVPDAPVASAKQQTRPPRTTTKPPLPTLAAPEGYAWLPVEAEGCLALVVDKDGHRSNIIAKVWQGLDLWYAVMFHGYKRPHTRTAATADGANAIVCEELAGKLPPDAVMPRVVVAGQWVPWKYEGDGVCTCTVRPDLWARVTRVDRGGGWMYQVFDSRNNHERTSHGWSSPVTAAMDAAQLLMQAPA